MGGSWSSPWTGFSVFFWLLAGASSEVSVEGTGGLLCYAAKTWAEDRALRGRNLSADPGIVTEKGRASERGGAMLRRRFVFVGCNKPSFWERSQSAKSLGGLGGLVPPECVLRRLRPRMLASRAVFTWFSGSVSLLVRSEGSGPAGEVRLASTVGCRMVRTSSAKPVFKRLFAGRWGASDGLARSNAAGNRMRGMPHSA